MYGSAGSVSEPAKSLRHGVEFLMLSPPADAASHGDALTVHQVSELLGVERSAVAAEWRAVAAEHAERAARVGWLDRLGHALETLEGLGTLREVTAASEYPPSHKESSPGAYALTRATLETIGRARLAWRRSGVTVLVTARQGVRGMSVDPQELMDHASELRHVVSGLVASGDVVSIERLERAVRIYPELGALAVLSGPRLSELAAAQISHVLSNRRGDLYLADLKPVPALAAVADTLPPREVTVEELRRRVRGRFPGALPLPDGAALDEAVQTATGRVPGANGYRRLR